MTPYSMWELYLCNFEIICPSNHNLIQTVYYPYICSKRTNRHSLQFTILSLKSPMSIEHAFFTVTSNPPLRGCHPSLTQFPFRKTTSDTNTIHYQRICSYFPAIYTKTLFNLRNYLPDLVNFLRSWETNVFSSKGTSWECITGVRKLLGCDYLSLSAPTIHPSLCGYIR